MEFFWYDYETGGKNARRDRAVQFSGLRTDDDLQPIEDSVELFCRPALDYLQHPKASLIHGHSIAKQRRRGVSEAEFALRIYDEFSRPNTCMVGYNALRFDHIVTQFLFYRNLRDPYAWHGKRIGNSKWATIDLVRAAYALRPDILRWPLNENGQPSFRLSRLAEKNDLPPATHDASADVQATIGLASLIRRRRPRLFDHYLKLRDEEEVAKAASGSFLWVAGNLGGARRYSYTRLMAAVYVSDDRREVLAVNLAQDPAPLLNCTEEKLKAAVRLGSRRFHLHRIKTTTCPFVFPYRLDGPGQAGLPGQQNRRQATTRCGCHSASLRHTKGGFHYYRSDSGSLQAPRFQRRVRRRRLCALFGLHCVRRSAYTGSHAQRRSRVLKCGGSDVRR